MLTWLMGRGLVKSSSNYIKNLDKDAMVLGKQIWELLVL